MFFLQFENIIIYYLLLCYLSRDITFNGEICLYGFEKCAIVFKYSKCFIYICIMLSSMESATCYMYDEKYARIF